MRQHEQAAATYHDMHAILQLAYTQPKALPGGFEPATFWERACFSGRFGGLGTSLTPYLVRRVAPARRANHPIWCGAGPRAAQKRDMLKAFGGTLVADRIFKAILLVFRAISRRFWPGTPHRIFPNPWCKSLWAKRRANAPFILGAAPAGGAG